MVETRGAADSKKKISKSKNPNLKEEKARTEKWGRNKCVKVIRRFFLLKRMLHAVGRENPLRFVFQKRRKEKNEIRW